MRTAISTLVPDLPLAHCAAHAADSTWSAFGFTLLGILIGAVVAHYLTKNRDAQAWLVIQEREADVRRRVFRRFVLMFQYTLERTPHDRPDEVWARYVDFAPKLLAEAALVEGDFVPAGEFRQLVDRAGGWRRADAEEKAREVNGQVLRDVLRDSVKNVYDFSVRERPSQPRTSPDRI